MDNHNIAEAFCNDEQFIRHLVYIDEIESYAYYSEEFNYYKILTPKQFTGKVRKYLKEHAGKNVTKSLTLDVAFQIEWEVHKTIENTQSSYISFKDKLFNLDTFSFEDCDINKQSFHYMNNTYEELQTATEMPLFSKFLDRVIALPDKTPDKELQHVLQEMFGYYLLQDTKAHAVFFLSGEGANGKSVLLNILRAMIGKDFVSSMSIETLTTSRWAVASLIGKRLNICSEEESKYMRSDKFKALVAFDPVSAERKGTGGVFTMIPTTKYVFATNEAPSFDGFNTGLTRRINIIPFNHIIPPDERDPYLTEKLLKELPAIVMWAIEGAKRFVENSYRFSYSAAMKEKARELEEDMSSALLFIRSEYMQGEAFISNETLYTTYKSWCDEKGRKQLNYHNFLKDLRRGMAVECDRCYDPSTRKMARGRRLVPKTDEPLDTINF